MVTDLIRQTDEFCETLTESQDALVREMLERVTAKWPLAVLYALAQAEGPLRFSRLAERVEGVSQKMLTQTLRGMERDGWITRTLYPQVPPRVEYELTALGGELLAQVLPLWLWVAERVPEFERAREAGGRAV